MGNTVIDRQLAATITYPESDGKPLGENTEQVEWIVKLYVILRWMFLDVPVFVAADLFWYPVQGNNKIVQAPDVMVVLGRPKGKRSSYQQWQEGGIGPQVVIEIRSPSNTDEHMKGLLQFYQTHGVEEYYVYDPEHTQLTGYVRRGPGLNEIQTMDGWVSPRLKIRFVTSVAAEPQVYLPDGTLAEAPEELLASYAAEVKEQRQRAKRAEQRAENAEQRAENAEQRAENAERIVDDERRLMIAEKQRAENAERFAEEQKRIAEELAAELARLRSLTTNGEKR